jgi:hypothetical protein
VESYVFVLNLSQRFDLALLVFTSREQFGNDLFTDHEKFHFKSPTNCQMMGYFLFSLVREQVAICSSKFEIVCCCFFHSTHFFRSHRAPSRNKPLIYTPSGGSSTLSSDTTYKISESYSILLYS